MAKSIDNQTGSHSLGLGEESGFYSCGIHLDLSSVPYSREQVLIKVSC